MTTKTVSFILTLKTWSSGPGQRKEALPKSNAMGCWNNGILEYWVWRNEIYFYVDNTDQNLKSGHHPLSIPNIPIFQHSIIPLVI